MASVEKLMQLNGAMGAFRFADNGELLEHQIAEGSELTESALDLLSHVCVANIAIATMQAFRAMGVRIEHEGDRLVIHGVGRDGLRAPEGEIDLGNSGTAMRLMMGLLAGQRFDVRLRPVITPYLGVALR